MSIDSLAVIYGKATNPYFIYAPRWISSSAGIKALHYLCHSINMKGHKAYLVLTESPHQGEPRVNPHLLTPILTQEMSDSFFNAGITPIVIYSETIPGNPLQATCKVRYLMNYAGALGGLEKFDDDEYILAFSRKIAEHYSTLNNELVPDVLFLPPIDPREFSRQEEKKPYQVVYAGKYRSFVGKPPKVGNLPTVEIFRDGPRMQSRDQVKEILKNASVLYSFENSSIVTEAILSGTPVKFVENEFLGDVIAEVELGYGGIAKSNSEIDLQSARESIDEGISQYLASIEQFSRKLEEFIAKTQDKALYEGFVIPITVPVHGLIFSKHRFGLARQIFKHQGIAQLIRVTYHFALRRLSWRFWLGRERIQTQLSSTIHIGAKESGN